MDKDELIDKLRKNLREALSRVEIAVVELSSGKLEVAQGYYDGTARSLEERDIDISDSNTRYQSLLESADKKGMTVRR